jgi:hypothetical protein
MKKYRALDFVFGMMLAAAVAFLLLLTLVPPDLLFSTLAPVHVVMR